MRHSSALVALAAIVVLALVVGVAGQPGTATGSAPGTQVTTVVSLVASQTVKVRLRAAVRSLPVAAETPAGYLRSKYRLWVDADGDCQDTRDEVLAAESKVRVTGCDVTTGQWFSYYDRKTWTQSTDVDIDHLVPLKENWDSGGRRWNADTRMRYANDLADPRTLVAVTDNVNQSKSDRDPAEWMPTFGKCRYVRQWTAVKIRWALKVDRAEKAKLTKVAAGCSNLVLTVVKANIVTGPATAVDSNGT